MSRACPRVRTLLWHRFAFFGAPIREKKYHYALQPKIIDKNEAIDANDPLLYKTVEPISKWSHSGHNWDPVVSKLIGSLLYDGERETAREVMRKTFAEIKFMQVFADEREHFEANPIVIINKAVSNCLPVLILHSVRRGGFIYKVSYRPTFSVVFFHNEQILCYYSLLFSLVFQVYGRNSSSTSRETATLDRARIRNVGLIAHIDAGKTTTTERMLFLSGIVHILCGSRFLFPGQTQAMGEVDRGDTVTDFLEEERERGISIMSATVCLSWQQHSIHLIDTPGHVDFTLEVERSLAVVDSALTIIDACKGVETQTRTVWHKDAGIPFLGNHFVSPRLLNHFIQPGRQSVNTSLILNQILSFSLHQNRNQADRHELPRLVFINKMDRPVADFNGSLKSLQRKLGQKRTFLPLHLPVFTSSSSSSSSSSSAHQHQQSAGGRFVGLVDLPRLDLKVWNCDANNNESKFFTINLLAKPSLQEFSNSFPVPLPMDKIMASALKAREHLISLLAELDEEFAEEYLSSNHPELLNPETINRSIRRATIASSGIPVLVGSSKQNIGVQLVMDALVQYLPDPSQRSPPPIISHYMKRLHNNPASASKLRSDTTTLNELPVLLVFKILFDSHWGALTLARVYSGKVIPGTHICNWTRQDEQTERNENIGRVLQLNGDSYKALRSAGPGCIVALTGLQSTRTGDVLGPPAHMFIVSETAKTPLCTSGHLDSALEQDVGFHVPGPVVHAALEPRSVSAIRGLERALARIQREDPSFTAIFNEETGQWVVGGMGDLHLEVILSRLRREYKLDVAMGPLLTTYKEMPLSADLDGSQTPTKRSARATVVKTGQVGSRSRSLRIEISVDADAEGVDLSEKPRVPAAWPFLNCIFCLIFPTQSCAVVHTSILSLTSLPPLPTKQVCFHKSWAVPPGSVGPPSDYLHSSVSWKKVANNLREACDVALATGGPLMRSRVVGVSVHIRSVGEVAGADAEGEVAPLRVPPSGQALTGLLTLLRATAMQAVTSALHRLSDWRLMEPIMAVEIQLSLDDDSSQDSCVAPFIGELSRRRGEIETIEVVESDQSARTCLLRAMTPVSELRGFSAAVRSLSSGRAEIGLRLANYRPVSANHQELLLGARMRRGSTSSDSSVPRADDDDDYDDDDFSHKIK
ncbi:unnamed protein product [Schistocephalus solidus]|uniref:Tr-type G domain-containing protein n=1 Tax=Schistocephalus solidus TaxID=70667 RepID=A0A183SPU1_SCHSO|nr:unnamed protein product [Schistocephalus solidus]